LKALTDMGSRAETSLRIHTLSDVRHETGWRREQNHGAHHAGGADGCRQAQTPTLEEFLSAPVEAVRLIAPATVVLGAGGTRRRAVLAGLSPQSKEYARWTREQAFACLDLILDHGVRHVIAPVLVHSHEHETTPGYSDQLLKWVQWAMLMDGAGEEYARRGWRVRLIGAESWPELEETAARVRAMTAGNPGPTVWFSVVSQVEAHWQVMLRLACERRASTREELVRLMYGEDVPPATLYIGTGKPQIAQSVVPPLLAGKLECYWRQHLGYDLDERTLRTILYDYAYVRCITQADKTGRAEQVLAYETAWEDPPVVGMGMRLGPFWYPAPVEAPIVNHRQAP